MKAFEFTLQRLLDAKEAFERAAEEKLAAGLRILEAGRDKKRQLTMRVREEIKEIEAFRGTKTQRHKIAVHQRFLERVQRQIVAQTQLVAKQELAVEESRKQLLAILRERKTLEKLKDREWVQWLEGAKKAEQKETDEYASVGFAHRQLELAVERQEGR